MYIDDLLIAINSQEEHLQHLRIVLECLSKHRILIISSKCVFGASEVSYVGHHIDRNGITPLKDKVQAICDFPLPDSQHKLHQFIGLVNFYHRFLPHGTELMQPLHALLTPTKRKAQTITWHDTAKAAFNATKESLGNATLLYYPVPNAPQTQPSELSHSNMLLTHLVYRELLDVYRTNGFLSAGYY